MVHMTAPDREHSPDAAICPDVRYAATRHRCEDSSRAELADLTNEGVKRESSPRSRSEYVDTSSRISYPAKSPENITPKQKSCLWMSVADDVWKESSV